MADETAALGHNFADGVCTVCGTGTVVNVTTGESYAALADALEAATAGDTVKLLADAEESDVMVYPGITLDLNGQTLTAGYTVGFDTAHIVDNAGGGKLIAAMDHVVLDEANGMVPVYDGTGYRFTKAGFAIVPDSSYTGTGVKINAAVWPTDMEVVEMLKDGTADNNLQVMIVLSWDNEQGTGSQDFVFTDAVVASVYSSNNGTWNDYDRMFSMIITGIESVQSLQANVLLVSGTHAEYGTTPVTLG